MRALYSTVCARCDRPIARGEEIARTSSGYVHVGCGRGE